MVIHQSQMNENAILGTAVVRIASRTGSELKIRTLCDNGSQVNLITKTAVQQLGGGIASNRTSFTGIGGHTLGYSLGTIDLEIICKKGNHMSFNFHVVKNITNYSPERSGGKWSFLKESLADRNFDQPGTISALLGVNVWIQIIEPEVLKSRDKKGIAHKTKLGFVIMESSNDSVSKLSPIIGSVRTDNSMSLLLKQMQRFWELEEVPHTVRRTTEEDKCEEIFSQGHSRTKEGRYIVRLPFTTLVEKLGKSKKLALQQFFAMEGRIRRNKDFGDKYRLFMQEYEALGHMEEILEKEERGYYTPHHGVITSTKFRVVFNASAKTTTGVSLNETQMVGEKLQRDLFLTLMNFRKFKYGIIGDIEKMYRQILVHPDDRQYQKILWRSSERDPIKVYQLKTVTYGQACAPHCAIRALVQCARDNEEEHPTGASIIKNCFYVDDLLTGVEATSQIEPLKREIATVLSKGCFNVTKWKTNGHFFEKVDIRQEEESSVLGLSWDLSRDQFTFKIKTETSESETFWTKRKILSKIGKLYDPNGFVGPVILRGKIIIQELWKDKLDWDEEIKGNLKERWESFNNDLENVQQISVNRWLGSVEATYLQIHGFCDASEKGYGAVLYVRTKSEAGFRVELAASKSKVAPLKIASIPRLELCSANLLVNLIEVVFPILAREKIQVYCWSDSQIVLQWLKKASSTLKVFVANRVANIQTKNETYDIKWQWISGKQNPADLISRGTSVLDLKKESKWWHGPDWLLLNKQDWPQQPIFSGPMNDQEIIQEMKTIHLTVLDEEGELLRGKWYKFNSRRQSVVPLLECYGTWMKLLRVTVTIFRAVHNFRNYQNKKSGPILIPEWERARKYLLRIEQSRTFQKEITAAKSKDREILSKLVVIWDKHQELLRIDGRVRSDNVSRDEQFPIVLSKKGILAKLLIRDAHLTLQHGGTQVILQYLRERYWIIGARVLAKGILKSCPICFRLRMKTSEQLMATLPTIRTTPQRAFSKVGVDYAGPVIIRSALGRLPKLTKAWIAVFVCLVTRAIHLELVSDATTQAFIAALRRMISRRGIVTEIISDNGTNFVGANNYIRNIVSQVRRDAGIIMDEVKVKWTFTTPNAPHHGGIYEAAVKSTKHHLTRVIGDTTLTFEEYATVLCQAEACVNSRPLYPLTDDPTKLVALTPGHFLIGEALVRIPDEQDYREIRENRLTRWEHLQKMTQHFWERWQHEYLATLLNRSKWLKTKENIKVDDMVIVKEDNLPPMKWKLGRIVEVRKGRDNLVRTVLVRTATGIYSRPIVKVGLLSLY